MRRAAVESLRTRLARCVRRQARVVGQCISRRRNVKSLLVNSKQRGKQTAEAEGRKAKEAAKRKSPPGRAQSCYLFVQNYRTVVAIKFLRLVLPQEDRVVDTAHLEVAHPVKRMRALTLFVY
jgi:hypothetical protein